MCTWLYIPWQLVSDFAHELYESRIMIRFVSELNRAHWRVGFLCREGFFFIIQKIQILWIWGAPPLNATPASLIKIKTGVMIPSLFRKNPDNSWTVLNHREVSTQPLDHPTFDHFESIIFQQKVSTNFPGGGFHIVWDEKWVLDETSNNIVSGLWICKEIVVNKNMTKQVLGPFWKVFRNQRVHSKLWFALKKNPIKEPGRQFSYWNSIRISRCYYFLRGIFRQTSPLTCPAKNTTTLSILTPQNWLFWGPYPAKNRFKPCHCRVQWSLGQLLFKIKIFDRFLYLPERKILELSTPNAHET